MSRHPDAGKAGELCYRTACQKPGADFWNASTHKYYCVDCARDINFWSRRDVGFDICVSGQSEPYYNELKERSNGQEK